MFFGSRKKAKLLEEEARKEEQARLQKELIRKRDETTAAYYANKEIFVKICHMVRSLPKKRQIVVVQRKYIFKDKHERNWCYLEMADQMRRQYRLTGSKWIRGFDDSLYAFYAPTKLDCSILNALRYFSEDGCRITHIRYYSFNF